MVSSLNAVTDSLSATIALMVSSMDTVTADLLAPDASMDSSLDAVATNSSATETDLCDYLKAGNLKITELKKMIGNPMADEMVHTALKVRQ